MLRLDVSDSAKAFRNELRGWLKKNPPIHPKDHSLEEFVKASRKWHKKLYEGGWLGVHWPKEYGGRGLSLVEEAIVQEELAAANSMQILGLFGLTMVGPVLIEHGTEEQRRRFLPKILSAEEIWCQGFSEPNAGSDLSAVSTTAVPTEGGFIVNGQKVWTSFAHIADYCFLLARTSTGEKPYHGLTYLLVDMKSKGITTKPLRQITGDSEFNEVFFDNVFVKDNNVVGEIGEGWSIAISTLMYERVILTFARQLQSETVLRRLLKDLYGRNCDDKDLAAHIANACALRATAYSHLLSYANGEKPSAEGSVDKLLWSEYFQHLAKFALNVNPRDSRIVNESCDSGEEFHRYLYSRGRTIAAGTSEIQRNTIAKRILGLK